MKLMYTWLVCVLVVVQLELLEPVGGLTRDERAMARELARDMFLHGYDGYIDNAFPKDELRPLTCDGTDTYGAYTLTLLDSLDALVVFGEAHAFREAVQWISSNLHFNKDHNVSVFETNIRVLGALISAHLMALPSAPANNLRTNDRDSDPYASGEVEAEQVVNRRASAAASLLEKEVNIAVETTGEGFMELLQRKVKEIASDGTGSGGADDRLSDAELAYGDEDEDEGEDEGDKDEDENEDDDELEVVEEDIHSEEEIESDLFSFSGYNNELLNLAIDLGNRLLPAFDTATGIPYGTVNLRYGVPPKETPIVCTACAGSFMLEFGVLSRLSGDRRYENAARRAAQGLYDRRSTAGLYGQHINSQTGSWVDNLASIGNYADSYFEYLLKAYVLFGYKDTLVMFEDSFEGAKNSMVNNGWWIPTNMHSGAQSSQKYDSFAGFWPGVLSLYGELDMAQEFAVNIVSNVLDEVKLIPELFDIKSGAPVRGRAGYPLRPELPESLYYLWLATGDSFYEDAAYRMLLTINENCRTECGFAAIGDVLKMDKQNLMDSFFLSETIKYLFLIFDEDNWARRENVVFTTEGHVLPVSQIRREQKYAKEEPWSEEDEHSFTAILANVFESLVQLSSTLSTTPQTDAGGNPSSSSPLPGSPFDTVAFKTLLRSFYENPRHRGLLKTGKLPSVQQWRDELILAGKDPVDNSLLAASLHAPAQASTFDNSPPRRIPSQCEVPAHTSDWRSYFSLSKSRQSSLCPSDGDDVAQ